MLVQPWMTRPYITERLLMGRKESNQTKLSCSYLCLENVCFLCLLQIFKCTSEHFFYWGKQYGPWSDCSQEVVWSGSILFAIKAILEHKRKSRQKSWLLSQGSNHKCTAAGERLFYWSAMRISLQNPCSVLYPLTPTVQTVGYFIKQV